MAQVVYRPWARLDLKDVFGHIAETNPTAAAAAVRLIDEKARLLANSPRIGQAAKHLDPRLRRLPVGNYLIFYEVADRGIDVIRVLHGARDIEALFSGDQE